MRKSLPNIPDPKTLQHVKDLQQQATTEKKKAAAEERKAEAEKRNALYHKKKSREAQKAAQQVKADGLKEKELVAKVIATSSKLDTAKNGAAKPKCATPNNKTSAKQVVSSLERYVVQPSYSHILAKTHLQDKLPQEQAPEGTFEATKIVTHKRVGADYVVELLLQDTLHDPAKHEDHTMTASLTDAYNDLEVACEEEEDKPLPKDNKLVIYAAEKRVKGLAKQVAEVAETSETELFPSLFAEQPRNSIVEEEEKEPTKCTIDHKLLIHDSYKDVFFPSYFGTKHYGVQSCRDNNCKTIFTETGKEPNAIKATRSKPIKICSCFFRILPKPNTEEEATALCKHCFLCPGCFNSWTANKPPTPDRKAARKRSCRNIEENSGNKENNNKRLAFTEKKT